MFENFMNLFFSDTVINKILNPLLKGLEVCSHCYTASYNTQLGWRRQ